MNKFDVKKVILPIIIVLFLGHAAFRVLNGDVPNKSFILFVSNHASVVVGLCIGVIVAKLT